MANIIKRDFFAPIKNDYLKMAEVSEGTFLKEVGFAIQHVNNQPYLSRALESVSGQNSIKMAVLNIAQTGLTLNPVSKQAFIVPRWNNDKKAVEGHLEPSYVGLCKLLTDTGSVKSIEAHIIFDGDEIDIDMASQKKVLKHIPYILTGNEKGNIKAVYSIATLIDGWHCEIMSYDDVMNIRERSESYKAYKAKKIKTCIWIADEGEMVRKTVIKRHYKYLPKTDRMEKIEQAIDIDNGMHGFKSLVNEKTIYYLEELVETSTFDPDQQAQLAADISAIQYTDEAGKMLDLLQQHQPNHITAGKNYNMGDIKKEVRRVGNESKS